MRWGDTRGPSRRGSWLSAHPGIGLWLALVLPHASGDRAMRLRRRTVGQKLSRRTARRCECMKYLRPYPLRRPADEPVVQGLARTVDRPRRIDPTSAALQDMVDPADHPPVIDTGHAPPIAVQKCFKPRKLTVRKPKMGGGYSKLPSASLNHDYRLSSTRL